MSNVLAILALIVVLGGAITYIVKSKKNGVKCIGCPSCKSCSSKKNENSCNCNN